MRFYQEVSFIGVMFWVRYGSTNSAGLIVVPHLLFIKFCSCSLFWNTNILLHHRQSENIYPTDITSGNKHAAEENLTPCVFLRGSPIRLCCKLFTLGPSGTVLDRAKSMDFICNGLTDWLSGIRCQTVYQDMD